MHPLQAGDPQRIGGYLLRARLGGGGMGTVYLGTSPGGRPVAVKVVRPDLADDPTFRARFATEVDLARRVHGFCTAPVVDADPIAVQPWLATLYVPAPSLLDAVRQEGPLPVPTARILTAGLAEALVAIHDSGIVHRDLKPSNVLLAPDGPRVIDFGIARALDGVLLTRTGAVVGSPGYMAPEHAEGHRVGPAGDIFSLGATVGYAATGHGVFGDGDPQVVLYRIVRGEPDLSAVPEALRELLARCLSKDAAARPTAHTILDELAPAAQSAWRGQAGWLPASLAKLAERQSTALLTLAAEPTALIAGTGATAPTALGRSHQAAHRTPGGTTTSPRGRRSKAPARLELGLHPLPRNGPGTSSLVLGIVGIVLFFGPGAVLGLIGLPLGVVGIVRARRGIASNPGVALSGVITSATAMVISLSVLGAIGDALACLDPANANQPRCQVD